MILPPPTPDLTRITSHVGSLPRPGPPERRKVRSCAPRSQPPNGSASLLLGSSVAPRRGASIARATSTSASCSIPTAQDRVEIRFGLAGDLTAHLSDRLVDVVILNEVSPLFARGVIQEGRLLRCTDPAATRAFRPDTQLMAADLIPFVERSRRRALQALLR